jgi:RimJ/RimL family protein N-acetyltransferase
MTDSLYTKNCILRQLRKEDLTFFLTLTGNKEVRRYLGGVISQEEASERFNSTLKDHNGVYWVIEKTKTERFIGIISLTPHGL